MESVLAVGIGYVAVLMPVLLIGVIFFFNTKSEKNKYDAMVEIAKNIENPSDIRGLLEELSERKDPIDYRRNGVITVFIGIGLFLLGCKMMLSVAQGVGLLVAAIGTGSIIAGYLYPNTGEELTNAVEKYEEK
jgi:hypothetical protein|tara:strand:- start:655 stop:1053 length:399 start_codon:yes stop_codon:yes gene_type:complete